VLAGRRNRQLRGPLTDAGRQRLREAAHRDQPWRFGKGPRTAEGKAASASNARHRQKRPDSLRQLKLGLAGVMSFASDMAKLRRVIAR